MNATTSSNAHSAFDRAAEGGKGVEEQQGVKHVVVLMLENRSFDNALGYLDSHHPFHGLAAAARFDPPPAAAARFDSADEAAADEALCKSAQDGRAKRLHEDDLNMNMNRDYFNSCSTTTTGEDDEDDEGEDVERVWPEPRAQFFTPVDPPHSHAEIMEQMFGEGRVPCRDSSTPTTRPKPDMSGFLSWYARRCGEWRYPYELAADEHHKVMHAHTPHDLPVLSTLAREYAFSDSWFSSMPGPTAPNRQFLHSATSAGHTANSGRPQHQATLFDMLDAAGREWKVYYHDISTVMTFSHVLARHDFARRFGAFEQFEADVAGDDFPAYCFIEPRIFDDPINGLYSNDQHPPHDVRRGEVLLARVYEAMRSSPHWESSLLLVLYDEHGGYYDHVAPPYVRPATKPGDTTTTTTRCGPAFDFSVLGPRVPAVFVSPRIERRQPPVRPRSDDQYFTHESFILTLAKMWNLDASVLEWQHDPTQIATFEWLWQGRTTSDDSHKEDVRLPSWRGLEDACVKFPHEGMDPYEGNYEVKWVGWAVASATFLRDTIQVDHPDVRRWCDDVIGLRATLSAGPFMDGFDKVVTQAGRRLAAAVAIDNAKWQELKATPPSALLPLLRYLDHVCHDDQKN